MAAPYLSKKTAQKLKAAGLSQVLEAGDYIWQGKEILEVLNPEETMKAQDGEYARVPTAGAFAKLLGCELPRVVGDVYVVELDGKSADGSSAVEAMSNLFLDGKEVEEDAE